MESKREQLIKTSIRLFSENGYHATGIDRITDEAGVSKKTLYSHFRTKEELILAALRQHDGLFRNEFMKSVEAKASGPYDRLLAVYDAAQDWFSDNHFYGCMFINAVGEYSETGTAIRDICQQFKTLVRGFIAELARQAGIKEYEKVAAELALIFEGAIVTAQVAGNPQSATLAKSMAKTLIDKALQDQKQS
ncbi:MAG: TetR/AcrR family transcriptional regulator [Gammaproteobacteria bacterium]|nr:TetR/AcrR family transcriptional regulator [Gammaproteobacteria bacterium]